MHNYFVAFMYITEYNENTLFCPENCIMVDALDTSKANAEQLDNMISQFTKKIEQSIGGDRTIKIINIVKMN